MKLVYLLLIISALLAFGCNTQAEKKVRVILDTDANNELDDQHALAYLLFNQDVFKIEAITINTTSSGGNIDMQYAEAKRILQLCDADTLPVLKGADKSFWQIQPMLDSISHDGKEAIDVIIRESLKESAERLTIIAIGKLSNVALAVAKNPAILDRFRLVWLGSNYPEPGEHNQNNDTIAMNYLLNSNVDFEMATVRYGKPSGTSAVTITKEEINRVMPGLGPHITKPVVGRHGGEFYCFGDYSINLFEHIDYHGDPPSRALFDLAAVAIVKDSTWAEVRERPAPHFVNGAWREREGNPHKIKIWENFNKKAIIDDFLNAIPKSEK